MHIDPQTQNAAPAGGKPTRRHRKGAREHLAEALLQLARGHGRIATHHEKSWASITFAGTRHRVTMEFEGAEAVETGECFIAYLPEHEFAVPRQLVADAAVIEVDHRLEPPLMRVTCELLLLEEG